MHSKITQYLTNDNYYKMGYDYVEIEKKVILIIHEYFLRILTQDYQKSKANSRKYINISEKFIERFCGLE